MKIFEIIKSILAPKKCYSCKKEWHFLCSECEKKSYVFNSSCYVCKMKSENFEIHKNCRNNDIYYDKMIIKFHYSSWAISHLVKDAKYYGKSDIMFELWSLLWLHYMKHEKLSSNAVLLPIPLHYLRKYKRGYNQSKILAKAIANITWIEMSDHILYRRYKTRQQSKLSKIHREKNMRNSFAITKKYMDKLDKKKIILVDDVVSTGSTINEAARILKMFGASEVIAICLASD